MLHSLLTLKSVVIPTLLWILPEQHNQTGGHLCEHTAAISIYSFLRSGLVEIFYVSPTCYMLLFYLFIFLKKVTLFSSLKITLQFQVSCGPSNNKLLALALNSTWLLMLANVKMIFGLLLFRNIYGIADTSIKTI